MERSIAMTYSPDQSRKLFCAGGKHVQGDLHGPRAELEFPIMNSSLPSADLNTHVKITVVALVAAIVLVAVGLTARTANTDLATASVIVDGPVLKAGKPATFTSSGHTATR